MRRDYSYKDLYPGMSGIETSNLATPEKDDQIALNESEKVSEVADAKNSTSKQIFIAIGLMAVLAIILGR